MHDGMRLPHFFSRSQLAGLLALAAVLFLGWSFFNLEMTRQEELTELARVLRRNETLRAQNTHLQADLEKAQIGLLQTELAWSQFGLVPRGTEVYETPEDALPEAGSVAKMPAYRQAGPPYWAEWIRRLRYP
jgi:hypothetical protein